MTHIVAHKFSPESSDVSQSDCHSPYCTSLPCGAVALYTSVTATQVTNAYGVSTLPGAGDL